MSELLRLMPHATVPPAAARSALTAQLALSIYSALQAEPFVAGTDALLSSDRIRKKRRRSFKPALLQAQ